MLTVTRPAALDATASLSADVDAAIDCEAGQAGDHAAEMTAVCRFGCGATLLMCEQHLAHLRMRVAVRGAAGELTGCASCRVDGETLDAIFDVAPLT